MNVEMEAVWLAQANSELRSEVLALKQENERLRALVDDYENGITWYTTCMNCAKLMDINYDQYCEIERLRAEIGRLRAELRTERAEVERLRAVLATIDNAHEPQVDTDLDSLTMGGLFCTEDDEPWPCRTHLLLHPKEARRA